MSYRGWNREELQRAGISGSNEVSNCVQIIPERAASFFTPINPDRASAQSISPLKTLRDRALDSNTSYDLPSETEAGPSLSNKTKRPSPQLNKGRSISHGLCWQYEDEGDVGYQDGTAFQESASKRRKSAPSKRSKSMKVPEPTLTQFWEPEESNGKAQQIDDAEVGGQNSQLTTPPDSGKRIKSRAKSAISESKPKQTSLFQKPTITKPLAPQSKRSNREPRSYAVINHQRWTTTEDAVKLNSNGTTKTTLDKLASFRYKPSSYDDDVANPDLPEPKDTTGHSDSGLQRVHSIQPDPPQSSSDYDLIPSNDSFFKEAMWNANIRTDPVASDLTEPERSQHAIQDAVEVSKCPSLLDEDPQVQPDLLERTNALSVGLAVEEPSFLKEEILHAVPPDVQSSQCSEYGELTSSEALILNSLMKGVDIIDLGEQGRVGGPPDSPITHELTAAALQQEIEYEAEDDQNAHSDADDNFTILNAEAGKTDEPEEISQHQQQINAGNTMNIGRRRSVAQIQVERSDTDDYEVADHQGSEDLYDMDEGLEDDDFLTMVSDIAVPETPLKVHWQQQNGEKSPSPAPATLVTVPAPAVMGHILESADASPKSTDVPLQIPSPRIFASESEDEFPMDEGDEEEMLILPELANGVEENFTAPAGISLPFGDDSDGREVYDPSLQYSPPTSRSSQSPNTVAYNRHTDRNSANQSPKGRSEIDQIDLEHEEDWTFICTGHGEAQMPDPFIDPPQPTPSPQRPQHHLSSSQILQSRSVSAGNRRTHSSATQMTSDITWSIIDDSHEYLKLKPFARPNFPSLVPDRCPVIGVSAQTFLRTCFRVGEMFKEGARRNALGQDVVIELFARVTFSSRDTGSKTQHFQFADLWHDRPPFPNGILANYKTTGLAESESQVFLESEGEKIARCLGRLKRDTKSNIGWLFHIINIRSTDWEEIRFTKNAVSGGLVKSETVGLSKL